MASASQENSTRVKPQADLHTTGNPKQTFQNPARPAETRIEPVQCFACYGLAVHICAADKGSFPHCHTHKFLHCPKEVTPDLPGEDWLLSTEHDEFESEYSYFPSQVGKKY